VSRVALGCNSNDGFQPHSVSHKGQALSQQSSNFFQSVQTQYPPSQLFVGPTVSNQCSPDSVFPTSFISPQQTQFFVRPQSTPQTSFQPHSTPQTSFQTNQPHHQLTIPYFLSPGQGQFIVYLLQYCPPQTSVCFGCGNTLKPNATIPAPPGDLVIVSKMAREWSYQGRLYRKPSNVYFHCNVPCVQRKQPNFNGRSCFVNLDIESLLTYVHRQFIRDHLGI